QAPGKITLLSNGPKGEAQPSNPPGCTIFFSVPLSFSLVIPSTFRQQSFLFERQKPPFTIK
ncbi:TPA: hypothetical protein ACOELZ_004415, partial [Enterobacter ludwigii]